MQAKICKMTGALVILIILAGAMLHPALSRAEEKSKSSQWMEWKDKLLRDPALIIYYDFNEGAGDILNNQARPPSENELNGALHGPKWTSGRWEGKKALKFDGKNNYVDIPLDACLNFDHTAGFSLAAWVKTTKSTSRGDIISRYARGSYELFMIEGKIVFWIRDCNNAGNSSATSTSKVSDNNWHYLVGVRDTSSGKLHIYGSSPQFMGDLRFRELSKRVI